MSTVITPTVADQGKGGSVASPASVPQAVKEQIRSLKPRIPMSAPRRRLETSLIPGFHLHWMKEESLPQAYAAHYAHVLDNEVEINTRNVSISGEMGSTADLSNRVTVQYGGDTMYLMKLPQEFYDQDMELIKQRNVDIWAQIFRGEEIAGQMVPNPGDTSNRYVKTAEVQGSDLTRAKAGRASIPLFNRKFK